MNLRKEGNTGTRAESIREKREGLVELKRGALVTRKERDSTGEKNKAIKKQQLIRGEREGGEAGKLHEKKECAGKKEKSERKAS